jgi:hypothetical protein
MMTIKTNLTTSELTDTERALFSQCEEMIQGAIIYQGKALKLILEHQLFRADYRSFGDYVSGRWQMSTSYAYQAVQHFDTYEATGAALKRHSHYRALERASYPALQLVADLLPKLDKISAKAITALVDVVEEAITTGTIETREGEQLRLNQITAIQAASLLEQVETRQRQLTHLSGARTPIATFNAVMAMEHLGAGLRGALGLDADQPVASIEVYQGDGTFTIRGKLK